jgi:dipeptidyl aminopeptidase/acylaminoacyl peptidase
MVMQRPDAPAEIYVVTEDGFKRISSANEDAAKLAVGKTEVIKWKSKDGREIEGLLHYPANYKRGPACRLF